MNRIWTVRITYHEPNKILHILGFSQITSVVNQKELKSLITNEDFSHFSKVEKIVIRRNRK